MGYLREPIAERCLPVAVGFSPRTGVGAIASVA